MTAPIDWLLEGDPWVVYRTRLNLLEQGRDDPQVIFSRNAMLANPLVAGLVSEPTSDSLNHLSKSQ